MNFKKVIVVKIPTYAICVSKYVKNKRGKYHREIFHQSFTGTWDQLEIYLAENGYMLEAFDCFE